MAGSLCGGGSLVITGSTINENIAYLGGGISIEYGSLVIAGSTITENGATCHGGGIWANGGTPEAITIAITHSTISNNTASNDGGGIDYLALLTITSSTISGNSAAYGGGILNYYGSLTITDSTISENSARVEGGGIVNYGSLTITHSAISGNSAAYGGGILTAYGSLTITDSTVAENTASQRGGGVYSLGTASVVCSVIAKNTAINGGGGIYRDSGPITLSNSIVADNTCSSSPDIFGVVASQYSLIENTSGASISGAGNLTGQDPLLGTLGYYGGTTRTIPLLPGSPAINTGSNALIPSGVTEDQRGLARIVDGTVDIGAYESQPMTLMVDTTVDENDGQLCPRRPQPARGSRLGQYVRKYHNHVRFEPVRIDDRIEPWGTGAQQYDRHDRNRWPGCRRVDHQREQCLPHLQYRLRSYGEHLGARNHQRASRRWCRDA